MNEGWLVSWKSDGQARWTHEDGSHIRREERRGRGRYGLGAGTWYVLINEREEYAARTLEGAQQRHSDYAQQSTGARNGSTSAEGWHTRCHLPTRRGKRRV